jgi:hypothetical protein
MLVIAYEANPTADTLTVQLEHYFTSVISSIVYSVSTHIIDSYSAVELTAATVVVRFWALQHHISYVLNAASGLNLLTITAGQRSLSQYLYVKIDARFDAPVLRYR